MMEGGWCCVRWGGSVRERWKHMATATVGAGFSRMVGTSPRGRELGWAGLGDEGIVRWYGGWYGTRNTEHGLE